MGQKEGQAEPLMAHLAERGWVCVTTNYRLSPRASWPDHIVDVKRALAWTKATIAEHGGDPDFVVITGGLRRRPPGIARRPHAPRRRLPARLRGRRHLRCRRRALLRRVRLPQPARHEPADIEGFLAERVFKSSLAEDRERWEQASPISHVGPHAPPFFVLHGTNDSLVPAAQARTFVDELRKESSHPVLYAELPGAQHAFDMFPSVRTHATVHAVERFLAVVRSEHGGATPAEAVGGSSRASG